MVRHRVKPILGERVSSEEIKRHDVLLGRSQLSARHIGNIAFRALVDSRLSLYSEATTKSAKTNVVVMVTNCIYEAGGRFIFPEDQSLDLWAEVDRRYAREKVGNAIRDGVKLVNSGKKCASSDCDAKYCEAGAHFASIVLGVAHVMMLDEEGVQGRKTDAATKIAVSTLPSSGRPTGASSKKAVSKKKLQPPPISHLRKATVTAPENSASFILGVLKKVTDEEFDNEDNFNETLTLGKIQELKDFDDDASFEDWKVEHAAELESSKDAPLYTM